MYRNNTDEQSSCRYISNVPGRSLKKFTVLKHAIYFRHYDLSTSRNYPEETSSVNYSQAIEEECSIGDFYL